MKAYTIIDKNERNAQSECVLHTFKELKELFKPEEEETAINREEWEKLQNIDDLQAYLIKSYDGMACPYSFDTAEVESLEQLQRMNEYLYSDELKEELLNN